MSTTPMPPIEIRTAPVANDGVKYACFLVLLGFACLATSGLLFGLRRNGDLNQRYVRLIPSTGAMGLVLTAVGLGSLYLTRSDRRETMRSTALTNAKGAAYLEQLRTGLLKLDSEYLAKVTQRATASEALQVVQTQKLDREIAVLEEQRRLLTVAVGQVSNLLNPAVSMEAFLQPPPRGTAETGSDA
jgi:hypothetical protein